MLVIAEFGRPLGVTGSLSVHPATDDVEQILSYRPWQVEFKTGWQPFELEEVRVEHRRIAVRLPRVTTPEEARRYTGKRIGVPRSQLPPLAKNEYYWTDLEGLSVVNHEGVCLGIIIHLFRTGGNDVIVVRGDQKRYLIPFLLPEVVKAIDLKTRTMTVDWDSNF